MCGNGVQGCHGGVIEYFDRAVACGQEELCAGVGEGGLVSLHGLSMRTEDGECASGDADEGVVLERG